VRADRIMHGKTSPIAHTGGGIFCEVPSPITAMRYHSLVVDPKSVPAELEVTAWTADRPRKRDHGPRTQGPPRVWGAVSPESVGTDLGEAHPEFPVYRGCN